MSETYDAAVEVREAIRQHAERTEEALLSLATQRCEDTALLRAEVRQLHSDLARMGDTLVFLLGLLEEWRKEWTRSVR